MSDHNFIIILLLLIVIETTSILILAHDRNVWREQALHWTRWLKDEGRWNDEGLLEVLTEQEKKLYHLRREYQIDD